MALIALPAKFGFTRIDHFGLQRAGVTMRSRFTGKRQVVIYPFAVWEFEGTFVDYPEDQGARQIRAFLVKLEGQKNTFKMPTIGYLRPSSDILYNYVNPADAKVSAAAILARATQIVVTMAAYAGEPIKEGEYFNINDELKMATADAVVAANQMTIQFQPPTRVAYALGTPVKFLNPYCVMASVDDDAASWSLAAPVKHGFKFSASEAF